MNQGKDLLAATPIDGAGTGHEMEWRKSKVRMKVRRENMRTKTKKKQEK
jgi:hypothetical protein